MATSPFSFSGATTGIGQPYVFTPGVREGRNPFSYPGIGASQYQNQVNTVIRPILQDRMDTQRQNLIIRNLASITSGSAPGTAPSALPTGAVPPTQAGPFSSLALTKDPQMEEWINSVVGKIQGGNLSTLIREPRSTQLAGDLTNAFSRFRGNVNDANQSLADFTSEFMAIRPQDTAALNQESNVIGNFFGGPEDPNSLIARLNQIAADRSRAVAENTGRGLSTIERSANIGNLARGAAGRGAGNSFVTGQVANATNALLSDEARQQADLARANLLDVTGIQGASAGQRGRLIEEYVRRGLIPIQLAQQLQAAEIANLGGLGQLDLANTLTERSGDQVARELGLIGGVRNLRASNRFEGLQKQITDPGTGFLPAFNPLESLYDFGGLPLTLDANTGMPIGEDVANVPNLLTTGGASAAPANPFTLYNQLTPEQLSLIGAEVQGGGLDYGPNSFASRLGLPGTTLTTTSGEFIRDPITGTLQPVGQDRLTPLQRLFE